jgi:demethylmenaquinone methyltransferase/2-methoxy-6-polyprenyl-1,4-benzoquinol methylase
LCGFGSHVTYLRAFLKSSIIKTVTPYQEDRTSKKEQVRQMFDRIARHYDFLNHFLSLGIDVQWRKKAIRQLPELSSGKILDVATGTGDMAFMIARKFPGVLVTGVDIAEEMLKIAGDKLKRKGLASQVSFATGDSENLTFEDNSFDCITVAFGVRNYENLQKGLQEMYRVVKPGGKVVILEFTKPRTFPFKQIFNGYFKHLLPLIGKLRSKDNRAYRYLYESVQAFPDYDRFSQELMAAGWKNPEFQPLTLGICAIYTASK